jgi:hypothetical protein
MSVLAPPPASLSTSVGVNPASVVRGKAALRKTPVIGVLAPPSASLSTSVGVNPASEARPWAGAEPFKAPFHEEPIAWR